MPAYAVYQYNLALHTEFHLYEADDLIGQIADGRFMPDGYIIYEGYVFNDGAFQFDGAISKPVDADEAIQEAAARIEDALVIYYDADTEALFAIMDRELVIQEKVVLYKPIEGTSGETVVFVYYDGDVHAYTPEHYIQLGGIPGPGDTSDIAFQMRLSKKGVLDTVYLNIGSLSDYIEWKCETASGVTVSLSQSTYKSLIIAETDDALSAAELEAFADAIDFTLLK